MGIERKAKVTAIGLCVLCLSTASGIGLSAWTMAGTGKFEELRAARSPAYFRQQPTADAFWRAQGRDMTPAQQ